MPEIEGKEIVYVRDVIKKTQEKIDQAAEAAVRLLPGMRSKIFLPLQEASTFLQSIEEVMKRSGMDKRLGFVQDAGGVQPVIHAAPEADRERSA